MPGDSGIGSPGERRGSLRLTSFDRRARHYDHGWLGRWHHRLNTDMATIVSEEANASGRVLDVGCGSGHLLGILAQSWPATAELVGVDPSAAMLAEAVAALNGRVRVEQAGAECLPFADGEFDVVLATTSFDHWSDQPAGLAECARVLRPGGRLMVADLFAGWLAVAARPGRQGRARTPRRMGRLLAAAGLEVDGWRVFERLGPLPLIQVVCAVKPATPLALEEGDPR